MPKQFTLKQVLTESTTIDFYEWTTFSITELMDGICNQLFSRTGFTKEQD